MRTTMLALVLLALLAAALFAATEGRGNSRSDNAMGRSDDRPQAAGGQERNSVSNGRGNGKNSEFNSTNSNSGRGRMMNEDDENETIQVGRMKMQAASCMGNGRSREDCVRAKLNFTRSAREEVEMCKQLVRGGNNEDGNASQSTTNSTGNQSNSTLNATVNATTNSTSARSNPGIGPCVSAVRSKAFALALVRLEALGERAARLQAAGVSNQTVSQFLTQLADLEARFNATSDAGEKKAILLEAMVDWQQFVAQARLEIAAAQAGNQSNGNGTGNLSNSTFNNTGNFSSNETGQLGNNTGNQTNQSNSSNQS